MKKTILLKIGGEELHLVNVIGALTVLGSAFGILGAVSDLLKLSSQVYLAKTNSEISIQLFGLLPQHLSDAIILGSFMRPFAWLMLWLGLLVVGAMLYRAGNILLPVEEEIREKED